MADKLIASGDIHIDHANWEAVEVVKKVVRTYKPDLSVDLGDLLSCDQFSVHPPTFGMPESEYENDVRKAQLYLDYVQKYTKKRTVCIAGNHEHRIDRWAAKNSEGKGTYNMLAPRILLKKKANGEPRTKFTYIPYGSVDGKYPHYKINSRLVAIHGWSYAINATKDHLRKSQGKSIIHGHTHRVDSSKFPNIWGSGVVQAHSAGCLCKPIPTYGTGNPVEWVNAFIWGYCGRHSDTLYTVTINNGCCVMPDGKEIKV